MRFISKIAFATLVVISFSCKALSPIIPIEDNSEVEVPKDSTVYFTKNINVEINITHYTPYCDGAPQLDYMDNGNSQLSNTAFILIDLATHKQILVQTNHQGILKLCLEPGLYAIRELYKNCTYAEFVQKVYHPTGIYFKQLEPDCYYSWWLSNLGEFVVEAGNPLLLLQMGTSEDCHTKNNPCYVYVGPVVN